jgi:hypothetical protein
MILGLLAILNGFIKPKSHQDDEEEGFPLQSGVYRSSLKIDILQPGKIERSADALWECHPQLFPPA